MHARRIPNQRDTVLQRDQRRRQPVTSRMMDAGYWRAISRRNLFVKANNESTTDENTVEAVSESRQFRHRSDHVRPVGWRLSMIGESVKVHCAEAFSQLCLGDQREKQVPIVLNIKGAE